MSIYKKVRSDLRKYYTVFLEMGLIASLLIFIIAMNADLPREQKNVVTFNNEQEAVTLKRIPRTKVDKQPAAPAEPTVAPKPASNDDPIIENIDLEIDDLTIDSPPIEFAGVKKDDKDEIFVTVEQEPEIIGGIESLYKKLTYPNQCRRAGIEGQVILQFVVNTDGSVQDIVVMRGIGGGCDKAAIKALKEVTFKPGRQRGKPVRVRYSWPVVFDLQ